ncbi:hypothetical protein LOZ39_004976 [Ophidiomyces ophidiicola]|nr:hypothetical protein LOZ64_005170 [Ophidiomyces ophidiicola]KAI2002649.1 hypothetical protein LOZ50_004816 [Ophidiomyces ophidiicola]KAI2013640.1 hypothetical protein LOZ46_005734 [Ophidiomyces ophidiicola]KAI2015686.1 hypothetical protein LOZ49_000531 [Ophidiomyces ophidiicola]KAI2065691.1 hypothetical protein LOZ40_003933 [Ophidiomyces ophidiicola]
MQAPHHRKIELQSTADLAYLYNNTLNVSREKLDLHFPPSANHDGDGDSDGDPMKARVRALVDEFVARVFTTAIPSISINGLDTLSADTPLDSLLSTTREEVEYEPYDARLAAKVTSLYAQLESLTTTVAQLRRDAPAKAAAKYAESLRQALAEDEEEEEGLQAENAADADLQLLPDDSERKMVDSKDGASSARALDWARVRERRPEWVLDIPFGNERERERWRDGEIGEVYAEGLRTLVRLQGEVAPGEDEGADDDGGEGSSSSSLSATAGKLERARRAVEVVERM